MAGLGTIMGGFGAAEQGAEAGIRQAKADQMQDRADELRTQQIAAEQALVPQRAALVKQQLTGAQNDLTDKETQRPMAQQAATDAYNLAHVESVAKVAQAAMTGAITTIQARDQLLGHLGMTAASGDSDSTAAMINELAKTPAFPRMKEFGTAVAAQNVTVPEGTADIAGNPISGPALAVKFNSGQTQYINPASWTRQVSQLQANMDKAAQVKLRPGDTIFNTRTGKAAFTAPPPAGMEYVGDNPDGSPIYRKLVPGGSGAGAGKGAGGKPTKDDTIAAVDSMLKDTAEKITVEQKGQAYTLAQRAVESGAVTDPIQAAQLGIDAALHPDKVKPVFNPETGGVDRVYQDPNLAQGRRVTVAPNAVKLEDYAKVVEPVVMKNLAEDQLRREASVAPPEQQGQLRDQWIKVANNPTLRAQFLDAAAAKGGAQGRAVAQGKLDLIQKYGPKPAGAAPTPSVTDRLRGGGGMMGGYTPPEGSPAARAAQVRAQAQAKTNERDLVKSETARLLSEQFQRDLTNMEPLALVRKYDSMRSQLNNTDAQALDAATRKL